MTSADREALRQDLIRDEGLKLSAYQDHLGFWTIGVGRLIDARKGGGITKPEAMVLLDNDIRVCMEDLAMWPWFQQLNGVRQRALLNMRFQLGSGGFRGFRQMRAALEAGDPALAAVRARHSKWAREDTPERAARVTAMLETGTV
jgi:lysozyme